MKGIIARTGGKTACCKKVLAYFPTTYDSYVEPFVGGGSIFFNSPKKDIEVINDLDSNLIDIYRVCKERAFEIEPKVFTEEEYERLKEPSIDLRTKVINKVLLTTLSKFGLGGKFNIYRTTVSRSYCNKFKKQHERLENTIICNQDYKDIIFTYDSPSTFFYLDPPYENSAKTVGKLGSYTDIDLDELKQIVTCIKGKFLLSLNDSERIRELFKEFTINEVPTVYFGRVKDRYVTDLIIKNF
jgi:DNA adenine methylase